MQSTNEKFKKGNLDVAWERGSRTTVTCAVNASGQFIPPMFNFSLEEIKNNLRVVASESSVIVSNSNRCADKNMYLIWLKHFAAIVKPTTSNPVLLVVNSHNSHTSLNAYEFCRDSNIHILCLPPHMAYKMQPLRVTFVGPLKKAYYRECELYMKNNNLKKVTPNEVAGCYILNTIIELLNTFLTYNATILLQDFFCDTFRSIYKGFQ